MIATATKSSYVKHFKQKYLELAIWVIALATLYFMQSASSSPSLCFFNWIGFSHCPGCGLGHSIHAALHLQFYASLQYHPLGIIAVIIILNRIKQLTFKSKK